MLRDMTWCRLHRNDFSIFQNKLLKTFPTTTNSVKLRIWALEYKCILNQSAVYTSLLWDWHGVLCKVKFSKRWLSLSASWKVPPIHQPFRRRSRMNGTPRCSSNSTCAILHPVIWIWWSGDDKAWVNQSRALHLVCDGQLPPSSAALLNTLAPPPKPPSIVVFMRLFHPYHLSAIVQYLSPDHRQ